MPSQKFGIATPSCVIPMIPKSRGPPRQAAAATPTGMAIAVESVMAISASGTLTSARSRIKSATGTE